MEQQCFRFNRFEAFYGPRNTMNAIDNIKSNQKYFCDNSIKQL